MDKDLFSIKMRGAFPLDHKLGGQHISGSECIVNKDSINQKVVELIERAFNHPKGKSDFINISIQKIHCENEINYISPLNISTFSNSKTPKLPNLILKELGFDEIKSKKALECLLSLKNIRGALIISFDDFEKFENKIVRCSNMDYDFSIRNDLTKFLQENNFNGKYLKDALCLSSKICSHENVICELCISDDKNYLTGYIASKKLGYLRIENFKPAGHEFGGRIIFIKDKEKLEETISYLKNSIVLINSLPKIINRNF